jgi:hypothetical protein
MHNITPCSEGVKAIFYRVLFLSIRRGELSFEEIFKLVDAFDARFREAASNTSLPDAPNTEAIEALMLEIYRTMLPA